MNDPRNVSPVFRIPSGVQSCTGPYVFFRLLVIVPAPRFTHRPRYECPTKPSCDLLLQPITTDVLSSPCTLDRSPIDDPAIRLPTTVDPSPIAHGPTIRVNACTVAPRRTRIGPAVTSKTVYGSITASRSMYSRSRGPMTVADPRPSRRCPPPPANAGMSAVSCAPRSRMYPQMSSIHRPASGVRTAVLGASVSSVVWPAAPEAG